MKVKITNLTRDSLSTDVGSISPLGFTVLTDLDPVRAYKLYDTLKSLVDSGRCSVDITEDHIQLQSLFRETLHRTQGRLDIWVNQSSGNDRYNGSKLAPVKTLTRAIGLIPEGVDHIIAIHIGPGNYTEDLYLSKDFGYHGQIVLEGTDMAPFSPPSGGTRTGNFDSFTAAAGHKQILAQDNDATWVENELRGCFVRFTSGHKADTGDDTFVVISNTTNTIEMVTYFSTGETAVSLAGSGYELIKPAATIAGMTGAPTGSATLGLHATPTYMYSGVYGYRYDASKSDSVNLISNQRYIIRNLNIGGTKTGIRTYASTQIEYCFITSASTGISNGPGCYTVTKHCYISGFSNTGISCSYNSGYVSVGYTYINGPGKTSSTVGFDALMSNSNVYVGNMMVIIENCGTAVYGTTLPYGLYITSLWIKNCGIGINYRNVATAFGKVYIKDCTSHGIVLASTSSASSEALNSGTNLTLNAGLIENCGGDGIRIEAINSSLKTYGALGISGNTGAAINTVGLPMTGGNTVYLSATMTIGANGANIGGDIITHGPVSNTIATLRAASNKTIIDSQRLTRIIGA